MRPLLTLVLGLLLFLVSAPATWAQSAETIKEEYFQAKVIRITEAGDNDIEGYKNPFQKVVVQLLDGPQQYKEIEVDHGVKFTITENQLVKVGQTVILSKATDPEGGTEYQITDHYRLPYLIYIGLFFFVLVVVFSGWRGFGSVIGLTISFLVISFFIVPQILQGRDPLLISLTGAILIMLTTLYLAHGFTKQTTVALAATAITLGFTALLAYLFVAVSHLTGLGSEDAYALRFGQTGSINFQGLLLGGIIIGTLGILDDITTAQTAAVYELYAANPSLKFGSLIKRSLNIGREHISSLVNTLVLAYAGVSLPLFLFFTLNPAGQPLWVIINSEFVAEEIIRTLAGSIGLVLAVPLTTVLAAWIKTRHQSS